MLRSILAAGLSAGLPLGATAQTLDEIEAWVYEPFPTSDDLSFQSAVITDSGEVIGRAIGSSPIDYSAVFVASAQGQISILPFTPFTNAVSVVGQDQSGRIAGTSRMRFPPYTRFPTIWHDGVEQRLLVPKNYGGVAKDQLSDGTVMGLITPIDETDNGSVIAVWTDSSEMPRLIAPSHLPPSFAGRAFNPLVAKPDGSIVGTLSKPDTVISAIGWLRDDLSGDTLELRSDPLPVLGVSVIDRAADDVLVTLLRSSPASPDIEWEALIAAPDSIDLIDSATGFTPFKTMSGPSDELVLVRTAGVEVRSRTATRSIDQFIASTAPFDIIQINDLGPDFVFATNDGRLVPVTCLADVNRDGNLDPADFNAWVRAFNTGEPVADQNLDQQITPQDFSAWLQRYNRGCD